MLVKLTFTLIERREEDAFWTIHLSSSTGSSVISTLVKISLTLIARRQEDA
jgi:hypothetical protein